MPNLTNEELDEYLRLNAEEETKKEKKDPLKDNMNWILIVILSIVQIALSCLSTVNGDVQFVIPHTITGWIFLIVPKVAISFVGYMIWMNFFDKGKLNAYQTEEYKKSQKILNEIQAKSNKNIIDVINPKEWEVKTKIKKGIRMVIMLALTAFLVSELLIHFTLSSLMGSILSLLISVFYGYQMMNNAEEMFSSGYLKYALLIKAQYEYRKKEQSEAEIGPKIENLAQNNINAQDEQIKEEINGNSN